MSHLSFSWIYFGIILVHLSLLPIAHAVFHKKPISPPVVQLQCTSKVVSITLKTESSFDGIVYVGDTNRDCRMLGKGTNKLDLSLPVKQCGIITVQSEVNTNKNKVVHHVRLYIQYHPLLQQDTDVRMIKECESSADDGSSVAQGSITDANTIQVMTPSWMEVIRGPRIDGTKLRGPIKVGETIGLLVRAHVNPNQDSIVNNCYASDGTSDEPERFIDENGCPLDSNLVPGFAKQQDGSPDVQTHWTRFPAFKFPDRTRLYLTCQVVVCETACPKQKCFSGSQSRKTRQAVSPDDNWRQARVVERADVVNSVQVVNTDLDAIQPIAEEQYDRRDKVCWPLKNLMTAIGILAAILLIALILALCFWWNRRQRKRRQYESSYGTQSAVNSGYNPSTNYYYMEQYPESHELSGNGHSETEPTYASNNGHNAFHGRQRDRAF
ncbi:hypothetical protein RvY_01553 [Ramazzottius varieornatus]|uniref:ZP domain-containing protein n=1 Tax=Ramazzottius varieornatus TaxID=947166 RepID=A0A1D1UNU0_RAMVA|nr:hypothetical protein RvY_01553 [Ramazzottius varieornatus]